jgi:hypothetical protein
MFLLCSEIIMFSLMKGTYKKNQIRFVTYALTVKKQKLGNWRP